MGFTTQSKNNATKNKIKLKIKYFFIFFLFYLFVFEKGTTIEAAATTASPLFQKEKTFEKYIRERQNNSTCVQRQPNMSTVNFRTFT